MSIINDLAKVREMAGRDPLPNPHVISGFGPDDPPAPPLGPIGDEQFDDPYLEGDPEPEPAPSPLIPRRPAPVVAAPAPEAPKVPMPDLVVINQFAAWKGREVTITEADEKAIRAIVLKVIEREVRADLAAAGVRRVRKVKTVTPEAPKKRGRPRKVQP